MKHLWINIDNNFKKYNFMIEQFKKNKLENIRIPAIIPNDFDNVLEQKRPLSCKFPGCTSCEYEYACLCSHIKAMKECLKYNDKYFVIMEDDIYLPFDIDYNNILNDINENIEIIQMMVLYDNTINGLNKLYNETNIKFIKWQYLLPSTGMYIISRKCAERFINLFINNNNKYDFIKSNYQIVADVLIYSTANTICMTLPYCVPNPELVSDIHPEHSDAHKKAIYSIKNVINIQNNYPYIIKKF